TFTPTRSPGPIFSQTTSWSSGIRRIAKTGGFRSSRRRASARAPISRARTPNVRSSSGASTRSCGARGKGADVPLLAFGGGLLIIATVLTDAFETVVLPRTVTRRVRLARVYFRETWRLWAFAARRVASEGRRDRVLAVYGPLSLLGLLTVWAVGLVV